MMKHTIFNFLLGIISLVFFIPACSTSQKASEAPKKSSDTIASMLPQKNSLLWKITGKDLKKPSYLFGTIHMIDKKDFFMPEKVKTAFAASENIVFEIDLNEMQNPMVMMKMMTGMMMNDNMTLKDLLKEEDYKKVKSKLDELPMAGMLGNMLERIKPMFLSTMITEQGMTGEIESYELRLMEMAKAKELPVEGLETVEYQLSMFDSISYQDQAKMLVEGLEYDQEESNRMMKEMVTMYTTEDLNGLYEMISEQSKEISNFEAMLLEGRNRNWIPVMKETMKEIPSFFAVGAGHLGGDIGVISLLRQEGYKVEAIMD